MGITLFKHWKKKNLLNLILIIFLICNWTLIAVLQKNIDLKRGKFKKIEDFSYLPEGKFLRIGALEYKEVIADILWLRAVQFVGGTDPTGRNYDWFYGVLDRVTDLDMKFAYAYQFGGIVLSVLSDHVDLSNKIMEKGLKNRPDVWNIPFHLGFNYIYHLKDPLMAAKYFEMASQLEGHPSYLPMLTARLYNQGNDKNTALAFLTRFYEDTEDEKIKKKILERIKELRKE